MLERNFDRDTWVYNKADLGDFSEAAKDAKRGKLIARKIRKERRLRSKGGSLSGGSRSGSPHLMKSL